MPDRSGETEARGCVLTQLAAEGVASARDCESRSTELGERHIQANSPRLQALATRKPDSYMSTFRSIYRLYLSLPSPPTAPRSLASPAPAVFFFLRLDFPAELEAPSKCRSSRFPRAS